MIKKGILDKLISILKNIHSNKCRMLKSKIVHFEIAHPIGSLVAALPIDTKDATFDKFFLLELFAIKDLY